MKQRNAVLILLLALTAALLLTGCGSMFSTVTIDNKTTIEMNNVDSNEAKDAGSITVEEGHAVVIEASLTKGSMKIDFLRDGSVTASVTANANERQEVTLEAGEYSIQATAVGSTIGKVTVTVQ